MDKAGVAYAFLGKPGKAGLLNIKKDADSWSLDIPSLRDLWFKTSYLLDRRQSGEEKALEKMCIRDRMKFIPEGINTFFGP